MLKSECSSHIADPKWGEMPYVKQHLYQYLLILDLIVNCWENYWLKLSPLLTSSLIFSNAFFEKWTLNFGWAEYFKWPITELMLSFIPTITVLMASKMIEFFP